MAANNSSCSHWWHAPFYLLLSLILAFISFTTLNHSSTTINTTTSSLAHTLALNASRALRTRGNFNIIATLLHISPELFFINGGPHSTIFAVQDSALSNLSLPPWEMRRLLRRHVTPSSAELFKKPVSSCFDTLLSNEKLVITGRDEAQTGSIEINNVSISHPDVFLEGNVAVHGVDRPFDSIPILHCGRLSNGSGGLVVTNDSIEWNSIVRLLSTNGYVSFAIGLNVVLDGILQDFQNLESVTIFAPPNTGFIASPTPFLARIVRAHIVAKRFTSMELAAAAGESSSLTTLVMGFDLKIHKMSRIMAVNGVEIVAPDMFLSKKFVVHGISRAFNMEELFSST